MSFFRLLESFWYLVVVAWRRIQLECDEVTSDIGIKVTVMTLRGPSRSAFRTRVGPSKFGILRSPFFQGFPIQFHPVVTPASNANTRKSVVTVQLRSFMLEIQNASYNVLLGSDKMILPKILENMQAWSTQPLSRLSNMNTMMVVRRTRTITTRTPIVLLL